MTAQIIRVTDDTDRAALEELLAEECYLAKREMPKVERFTTDEPTPWTKRHRLLDDMLADWESAAH